MTAQPTVLETASRLWNSLPSLWKALIPALAALVVVLLPANLLISSRFYAITTDNLRTQHQALLGNIGNAFDDLFAKQTTYLATLTGSDAIKACAAQGCTSSPLFAAELQSRLKAADAYYTEIGFIDLNGKETARAMRGPSSSVVVSGDAPMLKTDPVPLSHTNADQVYVFPISRDPRISSVEAYQQPVLRLAMPVFVEDTRQGYVTLVLNLDDFFAQQFVYSGQEQTFLLDTNRCLLASSDDTRRAELYKTWGGAPDRTCYADLSLEDWDTTVQHYHDTVLSTHVMHGPLTSSGQTWTVVIQQPTALAYGQADTLRNLLIGSQVAVIILVALLIGGADRATSRLLQAAHARTVEHARDIQFNPYVVGTPVEDRQLFFGRTEALARVIGAGVMGGDDVLIDGDRRIGKTSVLRHVERRLRERRVSDPNYWYWPVGFSLQGVPADMFYRTLMDHILRDAEEQATSLSLHVHGTGAYGVEDFREDITRILDLPDPGGAGRQTRIVLCLDNVHLWFGGVSGVDRPFIETFRNMLTGVGNQLKLIAAGTHVPAGAFGPAVTVVTLAPLSTSEAERLIRQPVANYYTFNDDAVNRIMADGDRLPMELQRLARHAVQIMLEQDAESITTAQAERALQRAVADWEPTYRLLWNGGVDKAGNTIERFGDDLRAALLDLSRCDDPVSPALWSGNLPLIARAHLDDIAYTDSAGNVRLMSIFKAWLARRSAH